MSIFDSEEKIIAFGKFSHQYCDTCETERDFNLFLTYIAYDIFYVFKWVAYRRYSAACTHCHQGMGLDTALIETRLGRDPINLFDRNGWLISTALVTAVFLILFYYAVTTPPIVPRD